MYRENAPCKPNPLAVTILGDCSQGGSYLLRIEVSETVHLSFGRFRQGAILTIPAGTCLYIGSAMNGLAKRLIRHAARTAGKPPHGLRATMLECFREKGLHYDDEMPTPGKRLHWHVDYLLDQDDVRLAHIYVLRSPERLETNLVKFLERDPQTFIIFKGLGASDSPGSTHLLGVRPGDSWWRSLAPRLESRFCGGGLLSHTS